MDDKKNLTLNILSNLDKVKKIKKDSSTINNKEINIIGNSEVKLDTSSFIMVPTNHPRIKEIIDILNSTEKKENVVKREDSIKKSVITLNEIKNNIRDNIIEVPKGSIITPLAKDYIKENKIQVITT